MNAKVKRLGGALVLALATAVAGYLVGDRGVVAAPEIPAVTVTAPPPGSVRVVYSLTEKRNDEELIALIEGAKTHIYFAVYTFTLKNVAEALVAAKARGVDVRGIVDSEQSANSYGRPVIEILVAGGIPVLTERHADGNGIMHIKGLVTDSAYAFGSYNWTNSATTINDEILEIGTDPAMVTIYTDILKKLLDAYRGTNAAAGAAAPVSAGTIDYTEAKEHVGERASVTGVLVKAYTSKSGTLFLDFCSSYKTCPFSGVIFADDVKAFGDLSRYEGQRVTLTGTVSSYNGRAEIKLSDPSQFTAQ
jgi:hypothetical protein